MTAQNESMSPFPTPGGPMAVPQLWNVTVSHLTSRRIS
jgi:hypothetical protein